MVLAVADRVAQKSLAVDDDGRIGWHLENAGLVAFAGDGAGDARADGEDFDQASISKDSVSP
jgi:hypothetical protein